MTEEQGIQIVKLRSQGLGYKQIAGMVNLSRDSVRSYCKHRGLTGYVEAVQMNLKELIKNGEACGFCGGPMKKAATGRPRRFCSEECRRRYWKGHRHEVKKSEKAIYIRECPYCKETFEAYGNKNRRYCCHDHYIKEYFSQDTETSVVTYKVYIRYREDVLSSMRIVWEGHTFEIVSALGDKRSGLLTLMAREIS